MKTKQKSKSHAKRRQAQREPRTFTPMETGQPDQDRVPGSDNPLGAQGGLGPLNQEGEGERQNDQLSELEQIKPNLEE
jgi:hypothetical protein